MKNTLSDRFKSYNHNVMIADIKAGLSAPAKPAADSSALKGQTPISCPLRIANFGIDTLHLTIDSDIPSYLLDELRKQKAEIQSGFADNTLFSFGVSSLFSWSLSRQGIKFYPYHLRCGDVSLFIGSRKAGTAIPNMRLHVGSISCQDKLKEVLKMFRMWCKRYNIVQKTEKVSRIDLASDLTVQIDQTNIDSKDHRICRSGKVSYFEADYKLSGFCIGSGDVMMRAYDKIREMSDKKDESKQEFFQKKWGDVPFLTRIEFQLRRGFIKEIFPEDSSFAVVNANIKEIWKYLTSDWFRLTDRKVDRSNNHQSRAETSPFWRTVQRSSGHLYRTFGIIRNRKQKHINIKALVKQAVGCMLSVCAGEGIMPDNNYMMFDAITNFFGEAFSAKTKEISFEREYFNKMALACVTF